MKKFLTLFLIVLGLLFLSTKISASTGYFVSEESIQYLPGTSMLIINDEDPDYEMYESTGYITLKMGLGNSFKLNISTIVTNFDFYNSSTLKNMYVLINLDTYYTSAVNGYWNFSNSNLLRLSSNQLKYTVDISNIPGEINFNIWWANLGYSGGAPYNDTGALRFLSAILVVEYNEVHDETVYCYENYSLLPESEKTFILIDDVKLLHLESNSYRLYVIDDLVPYAFDVSFPVDMIIDKFLLADGTYNISYSTANGERFIYLQPNLTIKPYPVISGTDGDPADLLVGFITINLSTSSYTVVNKLELISFTAKEDLSNCFMYLMFPLSIEEIVNIHIQYKYRYKYFGFNGVWQSVNNIYAWNDVSEINLPWWCYANAITPFLAYVTDKTNVLNFNTIQRITVSQIPEYVKNRYVEKTERPISDLTDFTHYKVHLGQFSTFGSTNYDIDESSITEITYLYDGIIYTVPYENIDQDNDDPVIPGNINWHFDLFFAFSGVNSIDTFINHLVTYLKESIVVICILLVVMFLFFIVLKIIFAISSIFRPIRYRKFRY